MRSIDDGVVMEKRYTVDASHNPILLSDNIPCEHHVYLEDTFDESSKDKLDDEEVVAAAGIMAIFAGAA